jgi:hypothetical protein
VESLAERLVNESDCQCPFTDSGSDSLDTAGANITTGEHAGNGGLQKSRFARQAPPRIFKMFVCEIRPRQDKAFVIEAPGSLSAIPYLESLQS